MSPHSVSDVQGLVSIPISSTVLWFALKSKSLLYFHVYAVGCMTSLKLGFEWPNFSILPIYSVSSQ